MPSRITSNPNIRRFLGVWRLKKWTLAIVLLRLILFVGPGIALFFFVRQYNPGVSVLPMLLPCAWVSVWTYGLLAWWMLDHEIPLSARMIALPGLCLFCLSTTSFAIGEQDREYHPLVPANAELPLYEAAAIAGDDEGRLYVAAAYYGRIQVYDKDGRFLHGWFLSGYAESVRVRDDHLIEVLSRSKGLGGPYYESVYTPRGELISKKDFEYREPPREEEDQSVKMGGSVYSIRGGGAWPPLFPLTRVVRIAPSGDTTAIISVPWSKWFWMCWNPGWYFGLFGMVSGVWIVVIFKGELV